MFKQIIWKRYPRSLLCLKKISYLSKLLKLVGVWGAIG